MSIHFLVLLSLFCFRADGMEYGLRSAEAGSSRGGGSAGQLVLVRHGESVSNKDMLLSWPTVMLTQKGRQEAKDVGHTLRRKGFTFDVAYTSGFSRAQESLKITLEAFGQTRIPTTETEALNTRTYGNLGRETKQQVTELFGEDQVNEWFSATYDPNKAEVAPPGGETLKHCDERAKKYFIKEIAPLVQNGKKVLVVTHRNPTISIMEAIEGKSKTTQSLDGMKNAAPIIYDFDAEGKAIRRTMIDAEGKVISSVNLV